MAFRRSPLPLAAALARAAAPTAQHALHCSVPRRALHVARRLYKVAPVPAAARSTEPATTRPTEEQCAAVTGGEVHPVSTAGSSDTAARSARYASLMRPVVGSESHFDLVVIGSGPAGQKCAIDAAKKGKRVCVVDKAGMFGGVCIHTGTIPSKTFREAILHMTAHNQRGFGGEVMARSPNLSRDVLERVRKVEQWETDTILKQLHRNKVMTIAGTAHFIDEHHVEIVTESAQSQTNAHGHTNLAALGNGVVPAGGASPTDTQLASSHVIRGDKFLIAAGSRPVRNPTYPWDSPLVFDSDAILKNPTWGEIKNLIVVGAGVIALEYASMFNTLPNCKVTIIDERPSFLDFIDHEVVDTLKYVMRRQGATFLLGEKVRNVSIVQGPPGEGGAVAGQSVRVDLDSGKDVVGDALFYAVGRQAQSDSLSLDAAGVSLAKRGLIPVNEFFQTSAPHIYASGDIIGFPALASTSMEQGRLCSQHMFGMARPMKPVFPYGIYTIPEISVVGHSEQELTKLRIPYKTGVAKYEETAKGQMMGGPHIDGFLKLMFCPTTHRLLGASAIGDSATEIIHVGQAVMSLGGSIEYFRDSVFNFPSYHELWRIAALDGLNKLGGNGVPLASTPPLSPEEAAAQASLASATRGPGARTTSDQDAPVQRPVPPA